MFYQSIHIIFKCAPPLPRALQIAENKDHRTSQTGKIEKVWQFLCNQIVLGLEKINLKKIKRASPCWETQWSVDIYFITKVKVINHQSDKSNIRLFQRELLGETGLKKLLCFILIAGELLVDIHMPQI